MTDRLDALEEAVFEAKRFLRRAKSAKIELEAGEYAWSPTIDFAAAKRSSMDLTRVLARLRRAKS